MPKAHPNSLIIFSFDLNEFSVKILFNIQFLLHHTPKHDETKAMHPYSSRAFQWYQEHGNWHCCLGDQHDKQNKLCYFIHKYGF
jgi:hypothetical protein